MYVDAAVGPVVGTPCHVTVISEGIDELPCPVTDAAALAGAGDAPVHVVPCANAVVLPSGKQIDTITTPSSNPTNLGYEGHSGSPLVVGCPVELVLRGKTFETPYPNSPCVH